MKAATLRQDHPWATDAHDWRARVAHAFSRAAPRYAQHASAQYAMAEHLLSLLPERARQVLDLGCGPGDLTLRLARHYGAESCVQGLDIAPGMLQEAQRRHGNALQWICADASALPFADASLDLVVSNLALQWCPDLPSTLSEIHRVLRPGGRALVNTLGPGTLREVNLAWSRPGRPAALLSFRDLAEHRHAAHLAGFRHVRLEDRDERFHYADLAAVMASIKGVGAQVARPGARLTRRDLAQATQRYELLRTNEGLPVTYHLLTLILEC